MYKTSSAVFNKREKSVLYTFTQVHFQYIFSILYKISNFEQQKCTRKYLWDNFKFTGENIFKNNKIFLFFRHRANNKVLYYILSMKIAVSDCTTEYRIFWSTKHTVLYLKKMGLVGPVMNDIIQQLWYTHNYPWIFYNKIATNKSLDFKQTIGCVKNFKILFLFCVQYYISKRSRNIQ